MKKKTNANSLAHSKDISKSMCNEPLHIIQFFVFHVAFLQWILIRGLNGYLHFLHIPITSIIRASIQGLTLAIIHMHKKRQ